MGRIQAKKNQKEIQKKAPFTVACNVDTLYWMTLASHQTGK